ncbi:hypothetical protein TK45_04785 [Bowmanella sp. JS7-9]|nr:hypothetical protein TK45_04785 [Bowmanella sp. JS7-9]
MYRALSYNPMTWQWTATTQHIAPHENGDTPFHKLQFLHLLEQSGCLSEDSGWQPCVLTHGNGSVVPFFEKQHSYGEFVFDWSWADAYHQNGLSYYPKLVATTPYTPVAGQRIFGNAELAEICQQTDLRQARTRYSSVHWLFISSELQQELSEHGYVGRHSVQFHWQHRGYRDFDDFLDSFTSRKRKSTRKERSQLIQAGIRTARKVASEIDDDDVDFFYRCYRHTYLKRSGHQGYLSRAFFGLLLQHYAQHLMLVMAYREDLPVASALFLFDENGLYGRYWGALESIPGLHFECCLYQGIEFCLQQNIPHFNPGTQGEHKILRGFEPVWCYSAHKLYHPDFASAVKRFCQQESAQLALYKQQAELLLPFKTPSY